MASSTMSLTVRSFFDEDDFVGAFTYATARLANLKDSPRWPQRPLNKTKNPFSLLRRCHGNKLRHPSLSSQLDDLQSLPEDDVGRLRDLAAAAKEGRGRVGARRRFRLAAARGGRFFRRRRHTTKQSWSPPSSGYLELEPSHTSSLLSFSSCEDDDSDGSEDDKAVLITSTTVDVAVDSDPSEAKTPDADLLFADFSLMENNLEAIAEEPPVVVVTTAWTWSDLSEELLTCQDEPPSEYLQLVISYSEQEQDLQANGLGEGGSCPTISVSVATFQVDRDLDESSSLKREDVQIAEATTTAILQVDSSSFADPSLELKEESLSEQESQSSTTSIHSWSAPPPPPDLVETSSALDLSVSSSLEPDDFHSEEPPSLPGSPDRIRSVGTLIADDDEMEDPFSSSPPPTTSIVTPPIFTADRTSIEETSDHGYNQPPIQNSTETTAAAAALERLTAD